MNIRMKWFYRLGFLLLLFVVIYVFFILKPLWMPVLQIIMTVLIPFLIAAFVSYLLHPVVELLHQKGMKRGIAVVIIYLLFFGGLGFSLYKGVPIMIQQVKDLSENAPVFTEQYRGFLNELDHHTSDWPVAFKEKIDKGILFVENRIDALFSKVTGYLTGIMDFIFLIAIIPFIAFYMLKDFEDIKRGAWYITPNKWRKTAISFLQDVEHSLGSYIRGQLIVCVSIGLISTILFWLIHLKYPLILGFIIGVTNVIPYFGPVIGAVPAIIIAAALSGKMVLFVIIIVFGLQFLEGNILSPLIVGKSLHMHPLMIMLALLIGGEVGGVVGLIIAVPILAILKVAIMHARTHYILARKEKIQKSSINE
ncbi:AI-2E family transporter [Peribacillus alkalitolerans]|uniref:AI-2E family transporter n=1 Tax=Peribacillus alkalitolerans TaxID=1550385 RepID=UPI0013D11C94|nr:AI-2E family transporter [Peribacillus alkalitolerans]